MSDPTDKIEIYKDEKGEWRWRRKARNGRIVGDSSEGYHDLDAVWKAASREADTNDQMELIEE